LARLANSKKNIKKYKMCEIFYLSLRRKDMGDGTAGKKMK
jgi:hypothetical protein